MIRPAGAPTKLICVRGSAWEVPGVGVTSTEVPGSCALRVS
ncbi:MAG: hypothetical protein ACRDLP_01775 [Solirubrobacteraceae bacterium]